jgi:hypothetical protein
MASNFTLRFMIEYKVSVEDVVTLGEIIDKMREYGEANIIDVDKMTKNK